MSIEISNESGTPVDEVALLDVARATLDRLRIHPLAELSVIGNPRFRQPPWPYHHSTSGAGTLWRVSGKKVYFAGSFGWTGSSGGRSPNLTVGISV